MTDTTHVLRRALSGILCVVYMALSTSAFAQGSSASRPTSGAAGGADNRSFDPNSEAWNGLSRLVALAKRKEIEVDIADHINWSGLGSRDVLVMVYPTRGLEIAEATNFVVDGGRMIVADDFGASAPFLDRLDVTRVDVQMGRLPQERFVQHNHALPVFEPSGRHPLIDGVDTVIANHPSVLLNVGGPVIAYTDGSGLVYDMNLGAGKVVVFGDASLFINHMFDVADDGRLVQNALDYICRGRHPCRVRLITGSFDQSGHYDLTAENPTSPVETARQQMGAFDRAVADFMEQLPATRLLYYLGILLAVGLALYLGAVFRLRPSRAYSHYLAKKADSRPAPQGEFDWNISRFGDGKSDTNYALPLAILKEIFEELFLDDLGRWPINDGNRPSLRELGRQYRRRYLAGHSKADQLEDEVVDLLATFAKIPTRHRVFLDSNAYFSARDLIKIYRRTHRVLGVMGLEEEYERRTQSLV